MVICEGVLSHKCTGVVWVAPDKICQHLGIHEETFNCGSAFCHITNRMCNCHDTTHLSDEELKAMTEKSAALRLELVLNGVHERNM